MFNNLNVRKKLLVGFGIILILTILIASFSMIELKKSNDSLKDLMAGAVKADDLIKENCLETLYQYAEAGDCCDLEEF